MRTTRNRVYLRVPLVRIQPPPYPALLFESEDLGCASKARGMDIDYSECLIFL